MSIRKTLGGERLGSGNKLKVDMHGFERSNHNLGYLWRSTMAPGTLVPFMSEVALPGDTFDINLDCNMMTHPTTGPLFGSKKVQLDVFLAPMRLYNSLLHNNMLGIGNKIEQAKIPQLELVADEWNPDTEDWDNAQINPSCILAYLGIRGIGRCVGAATQTRQFNAIPLLAYWEIYKNYYANKQEEIGAVIHTPAVALVSTVTTIEITSGGVDTLLPQSPTTDIITLIEGDKFKITYAGTPPLPEQIYIGSNELDYVAVSTLVTGTWNDNGTELEATFNYAAHGNLNLVNWRYQTNTDLTENQPTVATFDLNNIDDIRNEILAFQSTSAPYVLDNTSLAPYGWVLTQAFGINAALSSQEGLALKTYQSDLFNNWIQTEWIDGTGGITEVTSIDTTSGSFTLDTLNLSKKVYNMLNRIAVSGGTYNDYIEVQYDHNKFRGVESPMYMGGLIKELVFQEVVSNSDSGDQPLGTLAGKGILSKKHKGGHIVIKVDEPSYIIGIVSITPRIDYSQGNKWDMYSLKSFADLHVPALDEIGFQDLVTEQMAWWDTQYDGTNWIQKSAGKQPAWLNYMTNVNRVYGNFAIEKNEMFMTLNRRYEHDVDGISDLTTYIDPSKYNHIFAQTTIDAQNYWCQIAVDITARRKMSGKMMPNV